jgi:hypothetical protein
MKVDMGVGSVKSTVQGPEVVQVRRTSGPGETAHQRRRLSIAHVDPTGVVDDNVDRYVHSP